MTKRLTTRRSKGSALSHDEVDNNFEIIAEIISGNNKTFDKMILDLQLEIHSLKEANAMLSQQVENLTQTLELEDDLVIVENPTEVSFEVVEVVTVDPVTDEETISKEVVYSPIVPTVPVEESITNITVPDPIYDPVTGDSDAEILENTDPTSDIDYSAEIQFMQSEIERISSKISDWHLTNTGSRVNYGIIWDFHMDQRDNYLKVKDIYDSSLVTEYNIDNNLGKYKVVPTEASPEEEMLSSHYPYRVFDHRPYYKQGFDSRWHWSQSGFLDITADDSKLSDFVGIKMARTRILPSLRPEHVNHIPVGILFAQQYSSRMFGMWDENSMLAQAVSREINAYNALVQLDSWDDIKGFVQTGNVFGLFGWLIPGASSWSDRVTSSPESDAILEWANSKVAMTNLGNRFTRFDTEFTLDMLHRQHSDSDAVHSFNEFIAFAQTLSIPITVQNRATLRTFARTGSTAEYLIYYLRYRNSSTYVTGKDSGMNSLFMNGTIYSDWGDTVSNSILYGEPTNISRELLYPTGAQSLGQ